jgi:hypothetical protein
MGRKGWTQPSLWIPNGAAVQGPGHRFYEKLNELLREHGFDRHVEDLCHGAYASDTKQGRRSIPPGIYFRMLPAVSERPDDDSPGPCPPSRRGQSRLPA